MADKLKKEKYRTSIDIKHDYREAMECIWKEEGVRFNTQMELGLKLYFDKYKKLLKDKGIKI